MLRALIPAFLSACVFAHAAPSRVAIVSTGEQHWELRVDDHAYEVRGVTFSGTGGPAAYDRDCERLAAIGVNTLRTWGAGPDTPALLDAAHKHGLRVLLGLWFRHGQPGAEADDRFDYTKDTAGIASQQAAILESVRTYKNHPAVLAWGVGNEVFLNLPTTKPNSPTPPPSRTPAARSSSSTPATRSSPWTLSRKASLGSKNTARPSTPTASTFMARALPPSPARSKKPGPPVRGW